jgi:hypothetical protein
MSEYNKDKYPIKATLKSPLGETILVLSDLDGNFLIPSHDNAKYDLNKLKSEEHKDDIKRKIEKYKAENKQKIRKQKLKLYRKQKVIMQHIEQRFDDVVSVIDRSDTNISTKYIARSGAEMLMEAIIRDIENLEK